MRWAAPPWMKTAGLGRSLTPTPGCFARRLRTDRPERLDGYFQERFDFCAIARAQLRKSRASSGRPASQAPAAAVSSASN